MSERDDAHDGDVVAFTRIFRTTASRLYDAWTAPELLRPLD